MNNTEAYWLLFTDTLIANIFFTFRSEMINSTMIIFAKYDRNLIILISTVAAMIAGIINYIFGIVLYNIYKASPDQLLQKNYQSLSKIFHNRSFLMIFNVIPIAGNFLMIVAGFLRLSLVQVNVIIGLSRLIYYYIYL